MVRVDGRVMSETRYREYLQEQEVKPPLSKRVAHMINRYFFGKPEISFSDCIWFYGFLSFVGVISMIMAMYGIYGG